MYDLWPVDRITSCGDTWWRSARCDTPSSYATSKNCRPTETKGNVSLHQLNVLLPQTPAQQRRKVTFLYAIWTRHIHELSPNRDERSRYFSLIKPATSTNSRPTETKVTFLYAKSMRYIQQTFAKQRQRIIFLCTTWTVTNKVTKQ